MIQSCCGGVLVLVGLMASWTNAGNTTASTECENQSQLVDWLYNRGHVTTKETYKLMKNVDRAFYIPNIPYKDVPVELARGIVEIPPSMQAFALEVLKDSLIVGGIVLDVGFGSGYLSMCMAVAVTFFGKVIGIEETKAQMKTARRSFYKDVPEDYKTLKIRLFFGDVIEIAQREGPYDVIHVAPAVDPDSGVVEILLEQLDVGGRMMIPIGKAGKIDAITIYDRDEDRSLNMTKIEGNFTTYRELWTVDKS